MLIGRKAGNCAAPHTALLAGVGVFAWDRNPKPAVARHVLVVCCSIEPVLSQASLSSRFSPLMPRVQAPMT